MGERLVTRSASVRLRRKTMLIETSVPRRIAFLRIGEACGVTQQVDDLRLTLGRLSADRPVLELGQVGRDRRIEIELALFHEHHRRDAGHRLGHRRDPEDRVGLHRHLSGAILRADCLQIGGLAVVRDGDHRTGQSALVDLRLVPRRDPLQPCRHEAGVLGVREGRLQHGEEHDGDHQHRRHLVPPTVIAGRARIAVGLELLAPAAVEVMDDGKARRERELHLPPAGVPPLALPGEREAEDPDADHRRIHDAAIKPPLHHLEGLALRRPGSACRRDRRTGAADRAGPPSMRSPRRCAEPSGLRRP